MHYYCNSGNAQQKRMLMLVVMACICSAILAAVAWHRSTVSFAQERAENSVSFVAIHQKSHVSLEAHKQRKGCNFTTYISCHQQNSFWSPLLRE
jgi:uncharacterized lipoprotein YajG